MELFQGLESPGMYTVRVKYADATAPPGLRRSQVFVGSTNEPLLTIQVAK